MKLQKFVHTRLTGVALIFFLAVCWEVAVRMGVTTSPSIPRVSTIFYTWGKLIVSGVIAEQLGSSLYRMFIGYLIASMLGIFIGLMMGYFRFIDNLLEPIVELLRPIPTSSP